MQEYRKNLGKVSLTAEGAWTKNKSFDILSIVYDEHTLHGFISKQPVPEGVDLYNKEYWMPFNVSGYADNNVVILSEKTSETAIKAYTLEEAINSVAAVGRRPGMILGFYNENTDRLDIGGRWEIWQFNSTTISEWEDIAHWHNIYYSFNKFVGWYRDFEFLKKYSPFPEIGCYAYVGTQFNEATVYRCDTKFVWTDTTQHAWDYIKVIVQGNVTVGENGNWFNDGVDTNIPASIKGENGKTPVFRQYDNTIQYSFDNVNWITISDKVAAWFRWNATTGDTQANNVGRIQISRDNVTWTNLSGDIINNLHISRYIGADDTLPTSGIAEGTIYAKGPTYAEDDTTLANPIYRLWVYAWKDNTLAWQDNGEFTSISVGIVQEKGTSTTEVMSQDSVSKEFTKLELKSDDISKAQKNDAQIIGSVSVNLNDYSKKEGAISSAGAWNKDGYNRYHIAIPIVENTKRIIVKTNAEIASNAAIVKTYSETASDGTALDYAMGQSGFILPKNSDVVIDCPHDGKYLIITINSNTSDATPQNVGFSYGFIESKTNVENTISLLDKSQLSFPGYVDTNGVYQPIATTYKCTDYIPLNPKSSIRYKGALSAAVYAIAVYDENKNFSSIHSQLGNSGVALIEYCNNTTSMQYVRLSCKSVDLSNTDIWIDNIGIWAIPYSWDYGNIGTEGEIIEPITNNRLHSSLIPIESIHTISCDDTQTLGYVLYDENRNLVARYVAGVSELDIKYLALRYKDARYISILIRKADNSNYDIASESPYISIIKGEIKTFIPQIIKLSPKEKLPVIIFNFDDCDLPGDYEVAKLFESRGVRCGFAFVATEEKLNDRSDVYLDFQKRGFDIMNHSGTIDAILTSNYSFDEAKDLIVSNGLERLQKKGFVINGFVCPNSQLSDDFLPIIAKTHAYNMLGQPYGSNSRDANINKLSRYSLESNTKETIKAYVDECIANDKCLIFYAHTTRFGTTINNELFDLNKVEEILDYVIEKRNNLECWVGSTDEGIKYYFDL